MAQLDSERKAGIAQVATPAVAARSIPEKIAVVKRTHTGTHFPEFLAQGDSTLKASRFIASGPFSGQNVFRMSQNFLGIICYQGHGSAACLVQNGVVTDACAEERFSRIKQDTHFPRATIRHMLERNQLGPNDITAAGFAWSPGMSLAAQLRLFATKNPIHLSYYFSKRDGHHGLSRFAKFARMSAVALEFRREFGHCPPFCYVPHHLAHSQAACASAREDHVLSVVADGSSERASVSVFEVKDGHHRLVVETPFPHSFGILYSAVTQYLGFAPDGDEYKVMGLSAYGKSDTNHPIRELARLNRNALELDLRYFSHHRSASRFHSDELTRLLGPANSFEEKAQVARAIQDLLESLMIELIERAMQTLPVRPKAICTSGGVFLNCVLNQKIRERLGFERHHFSPIADDNGTALGAAIYLHRKHTGGPAAFEGRLDLGAEYSAEEIAETLRPHSGLIKAQGTAATELAANRIAQGRVVGLMQGRAEFGPRALGFRSLLADPRNPEMKAILNEKVKLRESFRPFAPSVLAEHATEYFEIPAERQFPYMIETVRVRPEKKAVIPAVTHVDGTARIQTVSRKSNPHYYELIEAFQRITGVPMVLNTSFNLDKQPIVNSPEDAVQCFLKSGIDGLLIGDRFLEKP